MGGHGEDGAPCLDRFDRGCKIHPMLIDDTYDGRTVDLAPGEELVLVLEERPTAGFRWKLLSGGEPACRSTGDDFESPHGPPGASGSRRLRFQAGPGGEGTIRLSYGRSWESAAQRTFEVRVRVQAPVR